MSSIYSNFARPDMNALTLHVIYYDVNNPRLNKPMTNFPHSLTHVDVQPDRTLRLSGAFYLNMGDRGAYLLPSEVMMDHCIYKWMAASCMDSKRYPRFGPGTGKAVNEKRRGKRRQLMTVRRGLKTS